jgi:hypothetical protein
MSFTLDNPRPQFSLGPKKAVIASITGANPYVNPGGWSLTPAMLGMATIEFALFMDPPSGHIIRYDVATQKVKAYWSGTASAVLNEVTNGTNLSAVTFKGLFIGT